MRDRDAPLTADELDGLAWDKMDGMLPAVVQDAGTSQTLMLGYMNRDALGTRWRAAPLRSGADPRAGSGRRVRHPATGFPSAPCIRLRWRCLAGPRGPARPYLPPGHAELLRRGRRGGPAWLGELARIVAERASADPEASYTARLLAKGPTRIAQKIGEEGVEVALAGALGDREGCISETADLLYHLTVLMQARGFGWHDVVTELQRRHSPAPT
jgi:phosphoribosyl-ATP pyrophosphohydrolase/phosphoribosyl-AMP cyclohydrolase